MYLVKVFTYSGNKACLVISYSGSKINSINLFSPDLSAYNYFYGPLSSIGLKYGLKNAIPDDHEEIHNQFGSALDITPELTKTHTTHFHWVGNVSAEESAILPELVKGKFIAKTDQAVFITD